VAAWRHGQLYLHDQTLRDAVDQLRRYYAGTIVLTDEALAERRVTGAYNLNDPEDALLGMARAHGARVRRITPWLIVLSSS
jgi:transmembrane sensor